MLTAPSPSASIAATFLCVASDRSDAPNCEALDTPLVAVPTSIRSTEPAVDARRPLVFALSVPSPNAGLSASTGSGGEGGAETGSAGDAGRALGSTRRRSASSVRMATPWMATTTIGTHVDVDIPSVSHEKALDELKPSGTAAAPGRQAAARPSATMTVVPNKPIGPA